jgi:hypothetical protein
MHVAFIGSVDFQSPTYPARRGLCVAGKVNSADKLYLVIESVRLDAKHRRRSTAPVPSDGAGGHAVR